MAAVMEIMEVIHIHVQRLGLVKPNRSKVYVLLVCGELEDIRDL